MWKGGMGELREGIVSGRGWVRRGEGAEEEESERGREGGKIMEFLGDKYFGY